MKMNTRQTNLREILNCSAAPPPLKPTENYTKTCIICPAEKRYYRMKNFSGQIGEESKKMHHKLSLTEVNMAMRQAHILAGRKYLAKLCKIGKDGKMRKI